MKKSSICLVIILLFGGFVFWKGWSQLKIDSDKFGVLFTKTNGVLSKPLMPGEFNWNWQFLLPTNAELKLFTIEPVFVNETVNGQLPSGDLYTKSLNLNYNFDYSFTFDISLTLSPESVIELINLNQISNDENLKEYLTSAAKTVAQFTTDYYLKRIQENPDFRPESLRMEDILRSIQLYKEFPLVEVFSISVSQVKLPDYQSYNQLKKNFLESNKLNQNNLDSNIKNQTNVE